jgi:tripartite motif-containing protein 71
VTSGVASYKDRIAQGTPPAPSGFNGAWSVAYGPSGELYATDWFNHRVEKFNPDGSFAFAVGSYGYQQGQLEYPRGVAVSPDGSYIAVAQENSNIAIFTSGGLAKPGIVPSDHSGLKRPRQVAIASDNSIWVADFGHNRVLHMDQNGNVLLSLTHGGALKSPQGVVLDNAGHVFISDSGNNSVEEYDAATGAFLKTLTTGGNGASQTKSPAELALVGPYGSQLLVIADSGNNRVLVIHTDGTADLSFGSFGAGPGQFNSPDSVAYDPTSGDIAVADFLNNRVSIWSTS